MNVLKKKRIAKFLTSALSASSITMAFVCLFIRIHQIPILGITDKLNILAAKSILPGSPPKIKIPGLRDSKTPIYEPIQQEHQCAENFSEQEQKRDEKHEASESSLSIDDLKEQSPDPEDEHHSPDEKTYKIIESQFSSGGTKYENFYVKNTTDYDLNIAEELSKTPDVNIKDTDKPQVLIVHTHTSESYISKDRGFFYESFYPRTEDNTKNVTRVGNAIAEKLRQNGISTIHDTTFHDVPTYNGSYSRSAKTIKSNLEKYPSIQVVLDIHRDSLGDKERGKIKPTFKFQGHKAAQIMVIAGCDSDGSLGYPDWEKNLRFALRVHQKCETMFPGITRPMFFGKVKYNFNLTHGSVLIEVGSDVNTLEEAVISGNMVGESLSKVLLELRG